MSSITHAIRGVIVALCIAPVLGAQTAAEYAHRVDSLGRVWRALPPAAAVRDMARERLVPADSFRAGPVIVRADSPWVALGHEAAERLAPMVTRAYGRGGDRLLRHQFVLHDGGVGSSGPVVLSAVIDTAGTLTLRGKDFAITSALVNSWRQKAENIEFSEMDPEVRDWLLTTIPVDPPTAATWSDARVTLILAPARASRECADGNVRRCVQVLALTPTDDPAFTFLDEQGRRALVENWAQLLRRAEPVRYDRCVASRIQPACDSLVRMVPPDAVRAPVLPTVRQSFLRFALMQGGEGAFDRFVAPGTIRERIEAASKMPADTVVRMWRSTVMGTGSNSPALDAETAISAVVWAAICGALALRSSRWR